MLWNIIKEEGMYMSNQNYLRAEDVAEIMGISKAYAYKIMRKLNAELDEQGYITVSGRINRKYFMERTCYGTNEQKDGD
jgi:Mn-dependent DtxR family transcriptional regulator